MVTDQLVQPHWTRQKVPGTDVSGQLKCNCPPQRRDSPSPVLALLWPCPSPSPLAVTGMLCWSLWGEKLVLSCSLGGKSWDKPWKNRGSALCIGICAREEAASFIPAGLFPLGTQEGSASPCPTKLSFFHLLGSRSPARITREEPAPGSSSGLPTPSRGAAPRAGTGPPSRCSLHWSQ